jgi:hypothetical protein
VTGVERPLNPESPGVLTCGGGTTRCGGVTTGRGRVSRAYDKGYWHDPVASLHFLVKQISRKHMGSPMLGAGWLPP